MSNAKWLVIISTLVLLIQGCATTYVWVKPGDQGADDAVDLYNCTNDANRSGAVFNQSDYQAPPVVSESPFSNAGCYNPNVSDVNCLSATPQSLVPRKQLSIIYWSLHERERLAENYQALVIFQKKSENIDPLFLSCLSDSFLCRLVMHGLSSLRRAVTPSWCPALYTIRALLVAHQHVSGNRWSD